MDGDDDADAPEEQQQICILLTRLLPCLALGLEPAIREGGRRRRSPSGAAAAGVGAAAEGAQGGLPRGGEGRGAGGPAA